VPKKGHSEEQILQALHLAEGGGGVADICRERGISEATYFIWKKKSRDRGRANCMELNQLRDVNSKLRRLVADLSLHRHMLEETEKRL
jgi:putative transposase